MIRLPLSTVSPRGTSRPFTCLRPNSSEKRGKIAYFLWLGVDIQTKICLISVKTLKLNFEALRWGYYWNSFPGYEYLFWLFLGIMPTFSDLPYGFQSDSACFSSCWRYLHLCPGPFFSFCQTYSSCSWAWY